MFEVPDHDAAAVEDALGVPAAGFFCAGEIGPVGGRNFLHGFTATMAVFARPADERILELAELVARALAEDVGAGDVTARGDGAGRRHARARGSCRSSPASCSASTPRRRSSARPAPDDARAARFERASGATRCRPRSRRSRGPARALLAGERTALNLLGHLSGVATLTARFVEAVEGTGATILDTRKTTPGLRALEKAAVAAGGGRNHRMGLYDAILIKENHVALAGGIGEAVRRGREAAARAPSRGRVPRPRRGRGGAGRRRRPPAARQHGPGRASRRGRHARRGAASGRPRAELEASGGVTLDNVAEVAATGVDFISVGALTHSAPALDLSMLLSP